MASTQKRVKSVRHRLANSFRGQLTTAGQLRNTFEAEVPHDTTLERILEPRYWWSVHGQIRPLDRIEVTWEDGSRVVMLRCMGVDERAETLLVAPVPGGEQIYEPPEDLPKGYSLEFVSKGTGWRILQAGRTTPLRGGFSTALEAHAWLIGDRAEASPEAPADGAGGKKSEQGGGGRGGGGGKPPKPAEAGAGAS